MLFVGAFDRQLDDKGRLALPATFRDHLGDACYLAIGVDKCVMVVPEDTFEAEAAVMAARVQSGEMTRNQLRAVASSAIRVNLDKQGRITIDEQLRRYADLPLAAPATVAGAFDRLEIWAPERFTRINDDGATSAAGDTGADE